MTCISINEWEDLGQFYLKAKQSQRQQPKDKL